MTDHERLDMLARRAVAAAAAVTWTPGERADPAEAALRTALADLAELLGIADGSRDERTVQVPAEVTPELLYRAAATLPDEGHRTSMVIGLLPHLTDARFREVVAQLPELAEYPRSRLVVAVAERLEREQVEAVFASVMSMQTRDDFVHAIAALLPYLAEPQRDLAIPKVLRQLTGHPYRVGEFVLALAPKLTAPELAAALEQFAAATPPSERLRTLTWIGAHLTADQRDDTLDLILELQDGNAAAVDLTALAPHLDDAQLERAVAAAATRSDPGHRARALTGLIPHLADERRPAAIAAAVQAVLAAGPDDTISNIALPDLLRHLAPEQIQLILDMVGARPRVPRGGRHVVLLAPYLTPAQLRQALTSADSAGYAGDRYASLAAIAPQFPPGERAAAVDLALCTLKSYDGWAGLDPNLAAVMTPHQRDTTLDVAAGRADRASIMAGLAAHLDPAQLDRALAAGLEAADGDERIAVLVALAPHLRHDALGAALAALEAVPDPQARTDALLLAAGQMPNATRTAAADAALRAAGQIADADDRALALTRLADFVEPEQRPAVLVRAYAAAMAVDEDSLRFLRLASLIPACSAPARIAT
ncbi:hypothetical protein [Catellatospora sp. IY07-71]|uniref:hypothetical protein n=1 Tax=Catellatospora sp. IY07-71 TaxID=2728827 RepID=UPI001BB2EFD9|nr:hypothetical protein [Catellatospora sp. IY07-71]